MQNQQNNKKFVKIVSFDKYFPVSTFEVIQINIWVRGRDTMT